MELNLEDKKNHYGAYELKTIIWLSFTKYYYAVDGGELAVIL